MARNGGGHVAPASAHPSIHPRAAAERHDLALAWTHLLLAIASRCCLPSVALALALALALAPTLQSSAGDSREQDGDPVLDLAARGGRLTGGRLTGGRRAHAGEAHSSRGRVSLHCAYRRARRVPGGTSSGRRQSQSYLIVAKGTSSIYRKVVSSQAFNIRGPANLQAPGHGWPSPVGLAGTCHGGKSASRRFPTQALCTQPLSTHSVRP